MNKFADTMYEDLKEYFPAIAADVTSYYAMSDRKLCVNLSDNSKVVYDIYRKTLRIFAPKRGLTVNVLEDETEWKRLFGENLKKKIKENGYSCTQLADALGIHRNALNHHMNGVTMPTVVNLAKIAHFLGYPIECFFTFQDENE